MHDDMVEWVAKAIEQKMGGKSVDIARAAIEALKAISPTCEQCGAFLPFDYRSRADLVSHLR